MPVPVFTQNIIAVIWDFDRTLIPGYMQAPLFKRYRVDEDRFWADVGALPKFYRERNYPLISADTIYLSHILSYVRAGRFKGLNNRILREVGRELEFYPGIPRFLAKLKARVENNPRFRKLAISVEHYIVSTGLRQTIMGSPVEPYVDGIWGCEFLEATAPPGFTTEEAEAGDVREATLQEVGFAIDNTTKTRAIFEINKGVNKYPDDIKVNDSMALEDRRVPIENMVYIADGPSDVPVFSILNQYGGKTFAVYNTAKDKEFNQVYQLSDQGRVQGFGPADYRAGSHTARWLTRAVDRIAEGMTEKWERAVRERVGKQPGHIVEQPESAEAPQDAAARAAPAPSPDPAHLIRPTDEQEEKAGAEPAKMARASPQQGARARSAAAKKADEPKARRPGPRRRRPATRDPS